MQGDLFRIMDCALMNNMVLNELKFELLNYSLNESRNSLLFHLPFTNGLLSYSLNDGSTIDPSDTVRDLGVLLSNDCSWSPISVTCSRPQELWHDGFLSVFRNRSPSVMLTQNDGPKPNRLLLHTRARKLKLLKMSSVTSLVRPRLPPEAEEARSYVSSAQKGALLIWNLLPVNVKGATALESFKAALGRYLPSHGT